MSNEITLTKADDSLGSVQACEVGIWKRIERLMKERGGWSRAELSRESGVTQATLSRWAKGHHDPDRDSLSKVARALGVSIDQLLGERPLPETAPVIRLTARERRLLSAIREYPEIIEVVEAVIRLAERSKPAAPEPGGDGHDGVKKPSDQQTQ